MVWRRVYNMPSRASTGVTVLAGGAVPVRVARHWNKHPEGW